MNLIVGYIELRFKLFNLNDLKNNMIKILLFNILEYIILFISVLLITCIYNEILDWLFTKFKILVIFLNYT